jgi:hypothetical protein
VKIVLHHLSNTTPTTKASEMENNTPGITVRRYSFIPSPSEQFFTNTAFASEMIHGMIRRMDEATALLPIKRQTSELHSGYVCFQRTHVKIPEIYPARITVSTENSKPR